MTHCPPTTSHEMVVARSYCHWRGTAENYHSIWMNLPRTRSKQMLTDT